MLLSLRPLDPVCNVNDFGIVTSWLLNAGSAPVTLYFQLIDASRETVIQGFNPPGFRYVPASGSILQVLIQNIDDRKKIYRIASQPFPLQDPSIWSIQLLASDKLVGCPDVLLNLTEFSTASLAAVTGDIAVATSGTSITITLSAGATFANPPAAGAQLVIPVNSALYSASASNGGYYTVTGSSSSTVVTATKTSDLFYNGLTNPAGTLAIPVVSTGDVVQGPAIRTTSGLIQSVLRVGDTGPYSQPPNPYQQVLVNNF
jgi:hypothetical protein